MRADMCNMLEDQRPSENSASQKNERSDKPTSNNRDNDMIVTTSDISSVDLDSDDSCFAATVEVIKLAPVKKNKDLQQLPSSALGREQRMPSTTNVSQIDQHD